MTREEITKRHRAQKAERYKSLERVRLDVNTEYADFLQRRRPSVLSDLPAAIVTKIHVAAARILKEYPTVQNIWLTGSYAAGYYRYEGMPEEEREIIEKHTKKTGNSDFDFYVEPPVSKDRTGLSGNIDILPSPGRVLLAVIETKKKEVFTRVENAKWHFERLPAEKVDTLIELFEQKEYAEIKKLYSRHAVAPSSVCLPCAGNEAVIKWSKWYLHKINA